jgi:hypothetical protein
VGRVFKGNPEILKNDPAKVWKDVMFMINDLIAPRNHRQQILSIDWQIVLSNLQSN